MRMTISLPRQAHLTVPLARPIALGTLAALVKDAATQLDIAVEEVLEKIR
ncbi:MAG: hypothetical protein K2X03_16425 [Bryobacteraceae bacterium]|nr:hypothetical protein [Bryobacteraceae bacterium]